MNWLQAANNAWDDLEELKDDPGYALVRREILAALATRPRSAAAAADARAAAATAAARTAANRAANQRAAEARARQAREDDSQAMVDEADRARLDAALVRSRAQRERVEAEAYDRAKRDAEVARQTAALASRERMTREQEGVSGYGVGDDPEPPRSGAFFSAARRLRSRLDSAVRRARELARVGTHEAARRTADAAGEGLARVVRPLAEAMDGLQAATNGAMRSVGVGVGVVVAGAAIVYIITNKKG